MEEARGAVIVVGHRNPDTDSICSAIAYARLRQALSGREHRRSTRRPSIYWISSIFRRRI